jgi:hypothetical protein
MHYEIIGIYKGKREVIDEAETKDDANYLAAEYQLAYGKEWQVIIKQMKGELING